MSSIWASLSGIRAHQFMLDVVGTNLANADSTGYKSSRVTFAEMMSQTIRPASAGTSATGGTNPVQIGLGVEIGTVTRDFSQGSLDDTGNSLDLAMDGRGFVVLHDGTRQVYCRSTTFSVDANNNLVDSVNGYRLLNVNNEPISIPYNEQIPASQTANLSLSGNLSTGADMPSTEVLTTIDPFTTGGVAATGATGLNAVDSNTVDYVDGDTITISGTLSDGTAVSATFTYGAGNDGTTVGDLVGVIDAAWGADATAALDADGNITLTAAEQGAADVTAALDDGASNTGATAWTDHAFNVSTAGADGGTRSTAVTVYDSRGESHILTLNFERVSEQEWDMTASLGDDDGVLTKSSITGIRFNGDGSFNSVASGGATAYQLTIDYGAKADPQTLVLDFGTTGGFGGLTQFGGSSTATVTNQDGYAAGTLTSFSIGSDGTIYGDYTNNQMENLGQIMVATFDNPEGLESLGHGMWGSTINSGEAVASAPMSGRAGAIVSGALEASNVESAEELTKLIVAQHGFQLSTRAMSVSNAIIQELAHII
jgi:flagellar hook protein FlgE